MQGFFTMYRLLPKNLQILASHSPAPIYVVGGFVRDFLIGSTASSDLDLSAPLSTDEFVELAKSCGFRILAVYQATGTVKCRDSEGFDYEFTSFRSDEYVRGKHTPEKIYFTNDIQKDAKRRDFTMNAVYYDVARRALVDPLGGIKDIEKRKIRTVDRAEKVFGEDGLRLMRLARQAGQTGFTPTHDCIEGAKRHANLIVDISPERVYQELCLCLHADERYHSANGHYEAFRILKETGVLAYIFPDLWKGKGLQQRADFHRYDVLDHSLRALLYAHPSVRLAVLLHDIGKPFCKLRDGNSFNHPIEGEILAKNALLSLKAPKKAVVETAELVRLHMYDFDGKTSEKKLRRFLVEHAPILEKLLLVKQADFSGCKDDPSPCPTVRRWTELLARMKEEKVPFSLKELKVRGDDLLSLGIPKEKISCLLRELLLHCANSPKENEKEHLLLLVSRKRGRD